MTYTFVLRLIDNFFRSWIRYLLPIVLIAGIGFATADRTEQYASQGIVFAEEESFLSTLTQVRETGFNFLGPGQVAELELQGLMTTDSFAAGVLSRASGGEAEPTPLALYNLRTSISTSVRSDAFITIEVLYSDPESAQVIATAVIDEFVDWHIAADVEQSQTAEVFYESVVVDAQVALDEANLELDDFLLRNPDPEVGERSTSEALQLSSLQATVAAAQAVFDAARANSESAQLATEQTEADVLARYRVVDRPQLASEAEPVLTDIIVRTLFFAALGFAVSASVLLLTTVTDTSVRYPSEVRTRLGVDVLAVVPSIRHSRDARTRLGGVVRAMVPSVRK